MRNIRNIAGQRVFVGNIKRNIGNRLGKGNRRGTGIRNILVHPQ